MKSNVENWEYARDVCWLHVSERILSRPYITFVQGGRLTEGYRILRRWTPRYITNSPQRSYLRPGLFAILLTGDAESIETLVGCLIGPRILVYVSHPPG